MDKSARDPWSAWLLEHRHGGDETWHQTLVRSLIPLRDRILERAGVGQGDVLLDVGCGDGLIAFGGLERVGASGTVIFSDVSSELLDVCRQQAIDRGDLDRCQFIHTGAEDLSMVSSGSLDAVTMRAVLIYVKDKIGSLGEAFRVLRPTGRLVIHEPINRFIVSDTETRFSGYDVTAVSDIAVKIEAFYEMIQDPTDDPMMDFDERDLMDLALQAGFAEVHIEYQADIASHVAPQPWDRFTATAGNPLVPTLGEAIKRCLTDAEAATFSDHLRPLVERGVGIHRMAGVLLWATKE